MNSKQNNRKVPLDKIKRTIKRLSQTTEYRIMEIFADLGYFTFPQTYTDFNSVKQIEVARKLDFFAYKPTFFPKNETEDLFVALCFLGDVKYYPDEKKRILVGFTPLRSAPRKYDPNEFSTHDLPIALEYLASLAVLYPSEIIPLLLKNAKKFDLKGLEWFKFVGCQQLVPFDYKGNQIKESKKFELNSFCNQVSSGFLSWKNTEFMQESVSIPLLVFGSEIEFIVGHPKDVINDHFKKPNAIFLLFQTSRPSKYSLIPILITSEPHLKETVNSIEKTVRKVLRYQVQGKTE